MFELNDYLPLLGGCFLILTPIIFFDAAKIEYLDWKDLLLTALVYTILMAMVLAGLMLATNIVISTV